VTGGSASFISKYNSAKLIYLLNKYSKHVSENIADLGNKSEPLSVPGEAAFGGFSSTGEARSAEETACAGKLKTLVLYKSAVDNGLYEDDTTRKMK
jgi:hypothetical protein